MRGSFELGGALIVSQRAQCTYLDMCRIPKRPSDLHLMDRGYHYMSFMLKLIICVLHVCLYMFFSRVVQLLEVPEVTKSVNG